MRDRYNVVNVRIVMCANCAKGEESAGDLKACTACMMVKYCNRDCQIAHRPQHKKACKKRAAELHDEKLFKEHPPREDCPICFLPLPFDGQSYFKACCGKTLCCGCIYATMFEAAKRGKQKDEANICPFCRTPPPKTDEDYAEGVVKLVEKGNANACNQLAGDYAEGTNGLPQDYTKAMELWHRAAELGNATSYFNIGNSYLQQGNGV